MVCQISILQTHSTSNPNSSTATELVTPPLEDLILPGITRDSVISIAKEHIAGHKIAGLPDNLVFSERHINMAEVSAAAKEGRLLEVFGSGESQDVC